MPRNLGFDAFSFFVTRCTGALWHAMALASSAYTFPQVKHLYIVRAMSGSPLSVTGIARPVLKLSPIYFTCLASAAFASDASVASCLASISSSEAMVGGSLRKTGM